jgi:AcrR family transcriptional regulator
MKRERYMHDRLTADRRKLRRTERVRREIVEGAARALAAFGPRATLREIARESGLAPASLYSYFDGKRDIVDRVMREVGKAMLEPLEACHYPEGLDPSQRLELLLVRELEFVAEHPWVLQLSFTRSAVSGELHNRLLDGLETFLEGEPYNALRASARVAARVLLGITLTMVMEWATTPGAPDVTGAARSIVRAFLHGMFPPSVAPGPGATEP